MSDQANHQILIKYGSAEFRIENLMPDHTVLYLKEMIQELTDVRVERQKILGLKPKNPQQTMSDDLSLAETNIESCKKLILMGSIEKDIASIKELTNKTVLLDDFPPDDEEDFETDDRLHLDPVHIKKIDRRIQYYQIKIFNPPRDSKKLLILDIDYTLIDHRATVSSASEFARPHLEDFLTLAYKDYDIVIWSATSMRWICAKMDELGISSSPNYKIAFYLDCAAMISIFSHKYNSVVNVKPLGVIWGKFKEQYSHRNSIMIDDLSRNFLMNPQNGLKIKQYKIQNKNTDNELSLLSKYLSDIAKLDDISGLDHKNWKKYKPPK